MQHFISDSNWSYRDAIDIAATQTSSSLRKVKLTGFLIDETGTEKKGDKSVGVGHQYCGNAGKTVTARLYLPEDWCDDHSAILNILIKPKWIEVYSLT